MSLLLTVYNTPAWKTFADISGLSLVADAVTSAADALLQPVQSLSAVSDLLAQLPAEQTIWLAIVQAEHFLANAIENGRDLEGAAAQWQQETNALLVLQAQKRRQLKLFNLQQALEQPKAFRDHISTAVTVNDYPQQSLKSSLALLAACQYITQKPGLRTLNAWLQASSLPLCDSETLTLDIEEIFKSNRASATQLAATIDERDLILSQLHQVQEQLEQYYLALQAEQSERRKAKARAANAEYASRLLQQELDRLRASTSWRITRPVRVISRMIRKTDKVQKKILQDVALLLSSEYFDVEWYLQTYADVAENQINPAEHYLLHGAAEGRLPGPLFDGNWYLQHYPDVAEANFNPLLHFIMFGQEEGRSPSPKLLNYSEREA